MRKIFSFLVALIMMFSVCSCSKTATVSYDIESEIENIKSIFTCVTIDNLMEVYSEEITSLDDLEFDGTFAGIDGTYEIELYEEGDNDIHEAGEIYSITFSWDYNKEVPLEDIAKAMTDYLGEPSYKDVEWGSYYWLATEMNEITKFSNAPFGNCFDVDIYGDDCCICFGLSTT